MIKTKTKSTTPTKKISVEGLVAEYKGAFAPFYSTMDKTPAKLKKTGHSKAPYNTVWFAIGGVCPICQNANTSGYCMVGIDECKPNKFVFRCKRSERVLSQKDEKGRDFVTIYMGEENGKAIEDVYYRQPSKDSDPTVANWVRDGDKSKSDLPVEDLKRFYKKSEPTYSVKETEPEFENIMYQFVLAKYRLSARHLANLKHRGFTDDDLKSFPANTGFGSIDSQRMVYQYGGRDYHKEDLKSFSLWLRAVTLNKAKLEKIVKAKMPNATEKQVSTKVNYLWLGVPGFYIKNVKNRVTNQFMDTPFLNDKWKGMLVPFYDVNNNLIRFQIRLDEPALEHVRVEEVDNQGFEERNNLSINVSFPKGEENSWNRNYIVTVSKTNDKSAKKIVIDGRIHKLHSWIDVTPKLRKAGFKKGSFKFKVDGKEDSKYYWLSSKNYVTMPKAYNGTNPRIGTPIEVAYQPKIAKLPANSPKLKEYQKKPKAIWITEGGLKALLAVRKLSNHFTDKELDVLGHDVLGVPGVGNFDEIDKPLKALNVKSVTLAYDMDMFTKNNNEVSSNLLKLAKKITKLGIKVKVALWNGNGGKGLDDILVSDKCYIETINLVNEK